jgi:ferrochelatase
LDLTDKETIGVLLLNLGGPDSIQAVRPFLNNLFSDREIIKLGPSFLQRPLAWLVSSLRSKNTKEMYSLIGGKSPILEITNAQAQALEKALNQSTGHRTQNTENPPSPAPPPRGGRVREGVFKVYIGMRYWHPFIKDTVEKILKDGIKHLIVLTLYPHYSKATTGSAIAEFKRAISRYYPPTHPSPSRGGDKGGGDLTVQYIEQWYDFPLYIDVLAETIISGISEFKEEKVDVLFSAHSLPESFIKEGDPYLEHIKSTISAVNSSLVTRYLPTVQAGSSLFTWHLSFQSRSGPVKWLQPSTDETIIKLAKEGVKNLFVVPISFVSDHIETLYEIDILYKKLAEKHGIKLKRCESLNTSEKFIEALSEIVIKNAKNSRWI